MVEPAGRGDVRNHGLPVCGRKRSRGISRAIVRTGRPLYVKRMPADSPAIAAMETAYHGRGIVRAAARGRIAVDSAG